MKRLDEIEQRAAAATPGEWINMQVEDVPGTPTDDVYILGACLTPECHAGMTAHPDVLRLDDYEVEKPLSQADAEFIAHARQDVPALVAALRAVLDRCEKADDFHDAYTEGASDLATSIAHAIAAHLDTP